MPPPVAIGAQITADATGYVRQVDRAKRSTAGLQRAMGRLEERATRTQRAMATFGRVTAAAAVFTGFIRGATSAIRLSTEWERQLINVGKNAGITGKELASMGDRLTNLSVQLGATRNELAEIARVAGQLGVTGVDNITNFTRIMFEFADATDVTAEEGAKVLQRFLSLSNLDTTNLGHLTDVITKLGSSAAVGESELQGMFLSLRVGSVGLELSIDFFGKLATILAEGGVQAEAARTGFLKFNQALKDTARVGGEDLQFLADIVGATQKEFRTLLDENPGGLLNRLYFGASGLDEAAYNRYKQVLDQEGARASAQQDIIRNAFASGRAGEIDDIIGLAPGERGRQAGAQRISQGGLLRSTNAQFVQQLGRLADTVTPTLLRAWGLLADVFEGSIDIVSGFFDLLDRGTLGALSNFFNFLGDQTDRIVFAEPLQEHDRAQRDLAAAESALARQLPGLLADRRELFQTEGQFPPSYETQLLIDNINRQIDTLNDTVRLARGRAVDAETALIAAGVALPGNAATSITDTTPGTAAPEDGLAAGANQYRPATAAQIARAIAIRDEQVLIELKRIRDEDNRLSALLAGSDQYRPATAAQTDAFSEATRQRQREQDFLGIDTFGTSFPSGLGTGLNDARIAAMEGAQEVNNFGLAIQRLNTMAEGVRIGEAFEREKERIEQYNREIGDSFTNFVAEPMRELFDGGSFSNAIDDALKRLRNELLELIFLRPLLESFRATLGSILGGGGGLGGLGSLLGGGFGALGSILGTVVGGPLGIIGSLFGFAADGGHVTRGGYTVVGEQGPEIRRLNAGDAIYPTGTIPSELAGGNEGRQVNMTINVNGVQDPGIVQRAVRQMFPEISDVVKGNMIEESRYPSPVSEAFRTA